jgi:hypothetical protein
MRAANASLAIRCAGLLTLNSRDMKTQKQVMSGHFAMRGYVRFTPESGHVRCTSSCPLSANSGHRADLRRTQRREAG